MEPEETVPRQSKGTKEHMMQWDFSSAKSSVFAELTSVAFKHPWEP